MDNARFVVTRQCYWSDGRHVVEVAQGGLDYSNPDALCAQYEGEFEEFTGMKPAVEKAIDIAKKWHADNPEIAIEVSHGCTHGMTVEFEGISVEDENGLLELLQEAEKFDDNLPKCPMCGDFLPPKNQRYILADDWNGDEFCSERCTEKAADEQAARWTRHYECKECGHEWTDKAQDDSYDENEIDYCPDCGTENSPESADPVSLWEITV